MCGNIANMVVLNMWKSSDKKLKVNASVHSKNLNISLLTVAVQKTYQQHIIFCLLMYPSLHDIHIHRRREKVNTRKSHASEEREEKKLFKKILKRQF